MGGMIGGHMKDVMEENMKKNQEFMLSSQRMQMERQMMMQQLMQQKMMAMQVARTRDMFHWVAAFTGTVSLACVAGFLKKKNPAVLVPLLPLSFITAYQYDAVYGDKMIRIRSSGYLFDIPERGERKETVKDDFFVHRKGEIEIQTTVDCQKRKMKEEQKIGS